MIRHEFAFVLCLVLSAPIVAQGAVVLPSKATTTPGNSTEMVLFGGQPFGSINNEARTQMFYDTADVGVRRATFRSLQFRMRSPGEFAPPPNHAMTADVTITMSVSPRTVQQMTMTYAQNHGPNPTTVFSGRISMPARTPPAAWPAPWEAPIVFSTPFDYDGNVARTLVIEVEIRNNSAQRTWWVELYRTDLGEHRTNHFTRDCRNSADNWSTGVQWNGPAVGRLFTFSYHGYPCRRPILNASAALFGVQGVGGTFLGRTLPFSLGSIGIDSRPGCMLANDVFFSMPMVYMDVNTSPAVCSIKILPAIPIPNDPSLADVVFYTQGMSLDPDPATGTPKIFPSSSCRWKIGDAIPVPGAFLFRQGDNQNPDGRGMGREAAFAIRLLT